MTEPIKPAPIGPAPPVKPAPIPPVGPAPPIVAPVVPVAPDAEDKAKKAEERRQAQDKADTEAAKHGIVAGKGGGTVEVDAPKDSRNKDGTGKHQVHVTADGILIPGGGPGAVSVVQSPDPETQVSGAPEDREDAPAEIKSEAKPS